MRFLPREHGLTVTWVASVLLAVLVSNLASIEGLLLFVLSIPTVSLYDPFLISIRQWKRTGIPLAWALRRNVAPWQKLLAISLGIAFLVDVVTGHFPALALAFIALPLLAFLVLAIRYSEMAFPARMSSILFLTGQFVFFSSALSGHVYASEITEYALLSLVNVVMVMSVRLKLNQMKGISHGLLASRSSMLLALIISAVMLYPSVYGNLAECAGFLLFTMMVSTSFQVIPARSIRDVGLISSGWAILTVVILAFIHFNLLLP